MFFESPHQHMSKLKTYIYVSIRAHKKYNIPRCSHPISDQTEYLGWDLHPFVGYDAARHQQCGTPIRCNRAPRGTRLGTGTAPMAPRAAAPAFRAVVSASSPSLVATQSVPGARAVSDSEVAPCGASLTVVNG